ncbi:MAG: nucleotide exchange factor GrpE [Firmicutes bacterium]|nr:nucleotide exchange factor GrpE [Candidatus Alectryobacillus merdavium]
MSEEIKENVEIKNDEDTSACKKEKKISISKYEALKEENAKLLKAVDDWKNKYYLSYADMDNLRKSIEKDHREALKYRASGFIEKLLPALDSFNLALKAEPKTEEMKNFLQGFSFIYTNLINVLKDEGVSELEPKIGDKFDERFMHAIDTIESDGEENLVAKVYANGYKLHDRLIRTAMVYVTKHKQEETDKNEENKENN